MLFNSIYATGHTSFAKLFYYNLIIELGNLKLNGEYENVMMEIFKFPEQIALRASSFPLFVIEIASLCVSPRFWAKRWNQRNFL